MKQLSLIGIVCSIKFVVNAHADRKNRTASDSETFKNNLKSLILKAYATLISQTFKILHTLKSAQYCNTQWMP